MNIESMIALAITEKLPVDSMERILAMRRELKSEWAKEQYDKAMAAFQADCPTIEKTKEVKTNTGTLAYKYAPIESIVAQVKGLLQEHGFSYSTQMELKENGVRVIVRVTHASGHSEESPMEVPFGNKTNVMSQTQVVAAAQTFAKRYAFCNAFGILTGDEDNDAKPEPTSTPNTANAQSAPATSTGSAGKLVGPVSEPQIKLINVLCKKKGVDRERVKAHYKVESMNDLTKQQAHDIIEELQTRPDSETLGEPEIQTEALVVDEFGDPVN